MSLSHLHPIDVNEPTDPLAPLKKLGVRVCWVTDLGAPVAYIPDHRVMLMESRLSRAEIYAYVRRWVQEYFLA